jgi:hypothetical protein
MLALIVSMMGVRDMGTSGVGAPLDGALPPTTHEVIVRVTAMSIFSPARTADRDPRPLRGDGARG